MKKEQMSIVRRFTRTLFSPKQINTFFKCEVFRSEVGEITNMLTSLKKRN